MRSFLRVIPRLDIKGPNLVKGIRMEGLRVLGKPWDFARTYYEQGADELIFIDAVASLYGRNSLLDIVSRTAAEIFIPLTVGGGLRTVEDIRSALRAGADKVAVNTAAVRRPELIREASRKFGSSTLIVSIEAIKKPDGSYEAFVDYGREATGVEVFGWAARAADLGAGEIMLTSIDREGTGKGYDVELTRRVAESVSIPVIACGGAGRLEHIHEVVDRGRADAVAVSSMLHYACARQGTEGRDWNQFSGEGNTEFLRRGLGSPGIQAATVGEVKAGLARRGVACRPAPGGVRA